MWDWFISVDLIPFTDLELQYVLDSKKDMKTRRLFMVDHEGLNTVNKSVTVMKNRPWSHRFKVKGPPHIPHCWSVMASGVPPNKKWIRIQNISSFSQAYLPSSTIHDKLTAIDVEVRYSMVTSRSQFSRPGFLKPVLGQKNLVAKDTVVIAKACASDDGRQVLYLAVNQKYPFLANLPPSGFTGFSCRLKACPKLSAHSK